MVLNLEKDMTLNLSKSGLISKIMLGVNWGKIKTGGVFGFGGDLKSVDLDLSALAYDENGKLVHKVYYRNRFEQGFELSKDDTVGDDEDDGKDNETMMVELDKVSSRIKKIVFVLVSFSGQDFGKLPYAQINLYNKSGSDEKLANTNVDIAKDSKFKGKKSLIFSKVELINGEWEYKAICEPTEYSSLDSLESAAKNY